MEYQQLTFCFIPQKINNYLNLIASAEDIHRQPKFCRSKDEVFSQFARDPELNKYNNVDQFDVEWTGPGYYDFYGINVCYALYAEQPGRFMKIEKIIELITPPPTKQKVKKR